MKSIAKSLLFCTMALAAPLFASYPDPGPAGFEDPAVLGKVMDGQIVIQDVLDTKLEFRSLVKAYFNRVSPEAYWDLAVNHAYYPKMFTEVKEGKTLSTTDDKLSAAWWLHLKIKVGFITQEVYPEGKQTFFPGAYADSEARIENVITNLQDTLKSGKLTTRLIPYENGILVEDNIHAVLQEGTVASGVVKKELKKFFTKYVSQFRKELQGTY